MKSTTNYPLPPTRGNLGATIGHNLTTDSHIRGRSSLTQKGVAH
jgi:hypothetical protein